MITAYNETVDVLGTFAMKGLAYTKEEILHECVKTIDKALVSNAIIVLAVIILTPIAKRVIYFYLRDADVSEMTRYYLMDTADNLYIIDYCVMVAYLVYVILLSMAW